MNYCSRQLISVTTLEAWPMALVATEDGIYVACINSIIDLYAFGVRRGLSISNLWKGQKVLTMDMPSQVRAMANFNDSSRAISGVMVSLSDSRIQIYRKRQLISELEAEVSLDLDRLSHQNVCMDLHYGRYASDHGVLAAVTRNGGLMLRQLDSTATLTADASICQLKMTPLDAIPAMPTKTQLYIDQLHQNVENPSGSHSSILKSSNSSCVSIGGTGFATDAHRLCPIASPGIAKRLDFQIISKSVPNQA
jgi:hypothetical protein